MWTSLRVESSEFSWINPSHDELPWMIRLKLIDHRSRGPVSLKNGCGLIRDMSKALDSIFLKWQNIEHFLRLFHINNTTEWRWRIVFSLKLSILFYNLRTVHLSVCVCVCVCVCTILQCIWWISTMKYVDHCYQWHSILDMQSNLQEINWVEEFVTIRIALNNKAQ